MTVGEKPSLPTWAGIGDFDVVWDWQNSRCTTLLNDILSTLYFRWFILASQMRGAVSPDPRAAPATWKKWDGNDFTRENFVEDSERFRDVNGDALPAGEHPSIHWNR